jgi:nucleotide-binding universal stress UspA family protein
MSSPEVHSGVEPPKRVLVAVDASGAALRVIAHAARLCWSIPEAVVHVVHVFRTGWFAGAAATGASAASDAIDEAKDHLDYCVRSAKKFCKNDVAGHLLVGDPTEEVLRLSGELKAELLVVGTHDYAGFERLLLGSVAETLTRRAHCSVLIVRSP